MAKPYSMDLRERAMARLAAAARQRRAGPHGRSSPLLHQRGTPAFVLREIEKTPHMTLQALSEALMGRSQSASGNGQALSCARTQKL